MADWETGLIAAIRTLSLHESARDALWVVPAAQSLHIICVGIVFSGALIVALRAFGIVGTLWTMARWQRRFAGWTATALVLLLFSGGVLVLAEPERELSNSLFQMKMPLVVAATLLSYGIGRQFGRERTHGPVSAMSKLGVLVVLALWAVIMGLGRWIAYAG